MKNKILIIIIIINVILGMSVGYYYEGLTREYYSLNDLKDLLKQTESMVICPRNISNPYEVCSEDFMIKTITDKNVINEIVSLIMPLKRTKPPAVLTSYTSENMIQALDQNGELLVVIYYRYSIALRKGTSSYYLKDQNKAVETINKLVNDG